MPSPLLPLAAGAAALVMTACAAAPPAKPSLAIAPDIDARVAEALEKLDVVQGIAVAVYTPEGAYAQGYGVADIETGAAVSGDTAFYIASSTKSYTALAMNILDHRGIIDLDTTLADAAPGAFPDAVKPSEVRLRDLLTHTSGVQNNYISFRAAFSGQHDPETYWRLLGASRVNEDAPLGKFQYTNVGYNILTILTDRQLGKKWQDVLADEIFTPAGMTHTSAYMSAAARGNWRVAKPHITAGPGAPKRMPLEKTDETMQSAGGMITSAKDAARWLELMAEDGQIGGKTIVPAEIVRETRAPLAVVSDSFGEYARDHYGLGWHVGRYGDETLVHHFGGFAGASAHISYMPARKRGVAVFINDAEIGSSLAHVIANYVYDALAGGADASAKFAAAVDGLVARRAQIEERIAADRANRAGRRWTLTQPRASYVGTYESDLAGTIVISLKGEDLVAEMGNLSAVAEPFTQPDTIRVELVPTMGRVIGFRIGAGGKADALLFDDDVYKRK